MLGRGEVEQKRGLGRDVGIYLGDGRPIFRSWYSAISGVKVLMQKSDCTVLFTCMARGVVVGGESVLMSMSTRPQPVHFRPLPPLSSMTKRRTAATAFCLMEY